MMRERREVVETVQGLLNESELAIEAAFTAIARLAIALPEARSKAKISPVAGQGAFDSVGAALSGIVQVRSHMVTAHAHLDSTREQYRMPPTGTGGGSQKPPSAEARELEIVRSIAA